MQESHHWYTSGTKLQRKPWTTLDMELQNSSSLSKTLSNCNDKSLEVTCHRETEKGVWSLITSKVERSWLVINFPNCLWVYLFQTIYLILQNNPSEKATTQDLFSTGILTLQQIFFTVELKGVERPGSSTITSWHCLSWGSKPTHQGLASWLLIWVWSSLGWSPQLHVLFKYIFKFNQI